MVVEQIIKFEWRGPGHLVEYVLLNPVISIAKQKSPKQIILERLLTAKNIAAVNMYFTSSTWANALTKFTPQNQVFKRVLDLICKERHTSLILSIGFQILKIHLF